MIRRDYELEDTVSKSTQDMTLWKAEKGLVTISKDTLAVLLRLDGEQRGYAFQGHGRLLLDTIAETDKGAIGTPVDKELNKPFLMLGNTEETEKYLAEATEEDIASLGYQNQEGFVAKVEDLCNQVFGGRVYRCRRSGEREGVVFAFQNEEDEPDILVLKGSKLVYKSTEITFVSNNDKVVLKNPRGVVCCSKGKSVIVQKDRPIIIRNHHEF